METTFSKRLSESEITKLVEAVPADQWSGDYLSEHDDNASTFTVKPSQVPDRFDVFYFLVSRDHITGDLTDVALVTMPKGVRGTAGEDRFVDSGQGDYFDNWVKALYAKVEDAVRSSRNAST